MSRSLQHLHVVTLKKCENFAEYTFFRCLRSDFEATQYWGDAIGSEIHKRVKLWNDHVESEKQEALSTFEIEEIPCRWGETIFKVRRTKTGETVSLLLLFNNFERLFFEDKEEKK